jgi:hypothetical protein
MKKMKKSTHIKKVKPLKSNGKPETRQRGPGNGENTDTCIPMR